MTHLVHTEAVRKTRRDAKWAARKRRTVTRERDPIFAAIDHCRQADAAFVAASHHFDRPAPWKPILPRRRQSPPSPPPALRWRERFRRRRPVSQQSWGLYGVKQ